MTNEIATSIAHASEPVRGDATKHVLIVEDEAKIAALLRDYLVAANFRVSHQSKLHLQRLTQRFPAASRQGVHKIVTVVS